VGVLGGAAGLPPTHVGGYRGGAGCRLNHGELMRPAGRDFPDAVFESVRPPRYTLAMKPFSFAFALSLTAAVSVHSAVDFQQAVLPVLQERCLECHGAEKQKGKLRLDTKADAFKGGKSGNPSFKAGDIAASFAIARVILPKSDDDHMPPEGEPLTEAQIKTLKDWVTEGANWPDGVVIAPAKAAAPVAAPVSNLPAKPVPPLPELPKDFKPAAGEAAALAALAKSGAEARPIAQGLPWKELNLRLLGTNVTDKTIEPLKELTSLIEVRLGTTKVTDAGLAALKNLDQLQVLGLELTGITDAGLAQLKDLKNLVYLNLYGTQVSDAGLESLNGLKHLRSLYLWQTKATAEGVKKLQAALPGLTINTGADLVAAAPATEKKEEKKDDKK
jgi:hypothetical protein